MDEQRGEQESTASGPEAGEPASERTAAPASERTDDRQLAPEARRSPRWLASLRKAKLPLLAALVLTIGGGLAAMRLLRASEPSCQEIWDRDLGYDRAVIACQREYDRTKDPRIGAILADSLRRINNQEAAKLVAHELLETKARPDALLLLGKIAMSKKRHEEALQAFEQAEKIYAAAGDLAQTSKTVLARANVLFHEKRFVEELEQIERCTHLARQAGAKNVEAACHAAAVQMFVGMGAESLAWSQLELVRKIDPATYDLYASSLIADMMQELGGKHWQATARFEAALAELERMKERKRAPALHLNLAFSFAALDKLADADDQLERAKIAGSEKNLLAATLSVAGFVEMKKGRFEAADALLARSIELSIRDDDWSEVLEAANDRAHMALARGELTAATTHALQATDAVEKVLSRQTLPLFRSWISTRYRRSYELLFLALAKQGRGEEALAVIDRWLSRGAIDSVLPSPPVTEELGEVLVATKNLTDAYASLRTRELASTSSAAALHQRLQGVDLVALVVAEGELWRVSSRDGAVSVASLGQYDVLLRELLDPFKASPFKHELASAVGALVLPPDLSDDRARPLHLVLDERMTSLPLEAMQRDGKLVLERRPIVRALRPSQTGCEPPRMSSPRATVVADSVGDLPGALQAAKVVGQRFHVLPYTGKEAKRSVLATPADLLHIGVHGDVEESGAGLLRFADGDETAIDIANRGASPKIVFLAACKSAVAEHGSYSMAAAFLLGGANQVVAALTYVDDALAARVATDFYKNGGDRDPATALATTLTSLAAEHERDADLQWPRFAVFGRPTCMVEK